MADNGSGRHGRIHGEAQGEALPEQVKKRHLPCCPVAYGTQRHFEILMNYE